MEVRFEEQASFETCAASCAIGGAVLGATGSLPAAAVGSAVGLLFLRWRGRRIAAACACAAVALAWAALAPLLDDAGQAAALPWPSAALVTGAMLGLLLAIDRLDLAKETGTAPPSGWAVALSAGAGAAAVGLASTLLPALSAALSAALPRFLAGAATGGSLGLWVGVCAVPLHLKVGSDAVEARLAAIRFSLGPDLRALAERAVAARRGALQDLPDEVPPELPASIDALAAAALELASRAAALTRAVSPQAEEELRKRSAALSQSAGAAGDPAAKQSYQRAAAALQSQLDHQQRVRVARERLLARLHEDVANLERTRFSLTLVRGPDFEAELTLLQERLRDGAAAFEEAEEPRPDPLRARA